LDHGPVRRDDLELPRTAVGESLGQALAFADETPDRGDLALGVAAENVGHGRLTARPERRHQGAGTVGGGIEEVVAEPLGPQTAVERGEVERLDAEGALLAPSVADDAVRPAEDA